MFTKGFQYYDQNHNNVLYSIILSSAVSEVSVCSIICGLKVANDEASSSDCILPMQLCYLMWEYCMGVDISHKLDSFCIYLVPKQSDSAIHFIHARFMKADGQLLHVNIENVEHRLMYMQKAR